MPGWLGGLVEESFFVGCGLHEGRRKNEKNIFCLGCCTSICPHCAPAHPSHPLLQVDHIMLRGEDLSSVLFRFDESDFTVSNLECLRVEGADPVDEDRNSSGGGGRRGKHKSGGGFFPQMALSLSNRRKGAPHRSPLS
ncbi:hypothetical protein B296_00005049 [Ensete ventricosum]|uniref:B box-type domain-containing protein n=1 Tax=Ensete ventricosum TaxID=4639 RepID=A0A427B845_ENSVE|nr:hypothetical protein B296_00005049 [Ensete ventricosum]